MKKEYIIVCDSYEYNDEFYFQPDDEGFTLHNNKLYTKEEAEKICAELNKKERFVNSEWDEDTDQEVETKINPYHYIKLEIE